MYLQTSTCMRDWSLIIETMSLAKDLQILANSDDFCRIGELLKQPTVNQLLRSDDNVQLIDVIISLFCHCTQAFLSSKTSPQRPALEDVVYECARLLRNSCALGENVQNRIINHSTSSDAGILHSVNQLIRAGSAQDVTPKTQKMCWQFLANLSVQNIQTQQRIWHECSQVIFAPFRCPCESRNAREFTMILYNIFIGGHIEEHQKNIIELLLGCVSVGAEIEHENQNDFLHIFMEHFITKTRSTVNAFAKLNGKTRLEFLYYIADHMRTSQHIVVHSSLLQHLVKEFKKKSDCVLKTVKSYVESIEPKEVVALLDVIAQASSDERYSHVLSNDGSLFLNVGCLLQTINKIGKSDKKSENIFTPVQKLGQLAPNSDEETTIERDISYQLKSMLVRTLGNLAYKNPKNQELAREMDIILAVLDSTSLDARNPLIKEWSILAVRNLCENNPENQQIIRQLTKVGDSNSDALKEFNLDLGSLRINPN